MKITYNKNPLRTTIELDEHEKKEFWYKIKIKELEELLFGAHFHLTKEYFDIEKARLEVEPDYYCTDEKSNNDKATSNNGNSKSDIDKRCDEMLGYYLSDLMQTHMGDCTCVPCSCSKCHAEHILGIDTMPGLGKHSAYKIDGAFGKNQEKSIAEAIESLANYNPTPGPNSGWKSKSDYEMHIPRWKSEAKVAHDWLVNYRDTFLKNGEN